MLCNRCGTGLNDGDRFCGSCGLPTSQSDSAGVPQPAPVANGAALRNDAPIPNGIAIRAIGGALLIGGVLFCVFAQNGRTWLVVLAPALAGLLLLILQSERVLTELGRAERFLFARKARADAATGRLARFVRRPFYASIAGVWNISRPIKNPHARAAIRATVSLYFVAIFVFVLLVAAYLIIAIAALVATIAVVGWVLSFGDGKKRAGTSERMRSWSGEQYMVHRDTRGRKTGESWERTGALGEKYIEHRDAAGRKTGESQREKDLFGDDVIVDRDRHGQKTGTTREEEGFFGDSKQVRFDNNGNKIGENRPSQRLGGEEIVENFTEGDKKGNEEPD